MSSHYSPSASDGLHPVSNIKEIRVTRIHLAKSFLDFIFSENPRIGFLFPRFLCLFCHSLKIRLSVDIHAGCIQVHQESLSRGFGAVSDYPSFDCVGVLYGVKGEFCCYSVDENFIPFYGLLGTSLSFPVNPLT